MQINDFKIKFIQQLNEIYPATEIESFFNLLTEFYLKMNRLEVAMNSTRKLTSVELQQFEKAITRLKNYEPIQYILGETEFYDLIFLVNKHVLIPRPETEELVDWVIQDLTNSEKFNVQNSTFKILDIGTGSGCIPVTLAKHFPEAEVSSIDISSEAIGLAKKNSAKNNTQVNFIQQDIRQLNQLKEKYQVIISNPPYVRELEKLEMHKNVTLHEPNLALYVEDENPLIFYKKIVELAKTGLTENGILYFEINQYLAEETKEILEEEGFVVQLKKDIFDNYRMCKAQQKNS